jgi:hypothetical protein
LEKGEEIKYLQEPTKIANCKLELYNAKDMDERQKQEILKKFKDFFTNTIAVNHVRNLKKLSKLSEFSYNPFTFKYLANFLSGNDEPESLARALIYPRILGTSISTSFGQNLQNIAPEIFKSVLGSTTSGMDLEFIDMVDNRKKYCQIKSGPNTINNDDMDTIARHFQGVRAIARVNNVSIGLDDLVIGVLYGTPEQLSPFYNRLSENYPVYVGKEFWYRLTGDEDFYAELIEAFGAAAMETDAKETLEEVVKLLAQDIKINFLKTELEE